MRKATKNERELIALVQSEIKACSESIESLESRPVGSRNEALEYWRGRRDGFDQVLLAMLKRVNVGEFVKEQT